MAEQFGPNTPLEEGDVVAIYAEGKAHACAIGVMAMDQDALIEANQGIAVNVYTYLTDGLWTLDLTQ